ncbi:phage virion morphogenesis protein [Pedobacter sp. NJ-S-72]
MAVNFTKERFRKQSWIDTADEPWKKRKPPKRGARKDGKRAVLVKSGRLMRSIRKIMANSDRAIIGTDVPYAKIHNNGGRVKATASIGEYRKKAYRRKAHTRTRSGRSESIKAQTIAAHTVKAHKRKINFVMPQRQFLGSSKELSKRIEDLINDDIKKELTR